MKRLQDHWQISEWAGLGLALWILVAGCGGHRGSCRGAGCLEAGAPAADAAAPPPDAARDAGAAADARADAASGGGDAGPSCTPGALACADERKVVRCTADGAGYVPVQDCDGPRTGNVCLHGVCTPLCSSTLDVKDSTGCEFWAVDLDNAFAQASGGGWHDAQGAPYAIVVSNPHTAWPATVTLSSWDEAAGAPAPIRYDRDGLPLDLSPLGPGQLRTFVVAGHDIRGTMRGKRAIRVSSSIPIIACQFNPLANVDVFSNDASLLLPTSGLGQEYYVMTREQTHVGLRGYVTIVGVSEDPTTVSVTVTAPTEPSSDGAIGPLAPGGSFQVELERFEVLNIETGGVGTDLTGTWVLADRPIVVFGGSEAANAPNTDHCVDNPQPGPLGAPTRVCEGDLTTPCDGPADCELFITCCADHLEMQLFPVATWGVRYLATRSVARGNEADSWRILAAEDNTRVRTLPPISDPAGRQVFIPVLNRGEWFDFETRQDFEITADRPILVGQFLQAEQAPNPGRQSGDAGTGDPAFLLAVPIEQFRTEYVFLTPDRYAHDYVNVVAPRGARVTLDGETLTAAVFDEFGTGAYGVARLRLPDGVHRLLADAPVGAVVYGYDQYVSYAYPAGLNLDALRPDP